MALFALLIAASSGWEAQVHFTHDPPRKSGGSDGAIHVSGSRVRLEEPTPAGLAVILSGGGKTTVVFPAIKQFLEVDPGQAALATVPPLSLAGMREVGAETVDGKPCAIWEKVLETKMGKVRERLWVPRDAKKNGFLFLRWVTQTDRGATRADLSEIREGPQAPRLFRIPAGYARK
jgi:hypothetical protein